MNRDQVAYFLTAQPIEPEDVKRLVRKIQEEELFSGGLAPDYSVEDEKNKRIFFDCGAAGGCIDAIDRGDVDQIMHDLAVSFPGTHFSLLADNVDNALDQYQICTYGDMYQSAELKTHMPDLSVPVPFDQRHIHSQVIPERDFLSEFLTNTDFNLLYKQKLALLHELDESTEQLPWQDGDGLSAETLEGLVNFLDFIGDWAEHEGYFNYPGMEPQPDKKPTLDSRISSAGSKVTPSVSSGKQYPENQIG